MGSTAWAAALMVTLAVVIAAAFILLWMKDKDRADEVSEDPGRVDTDAPLGAEARGGAAQDPPDLNTEGRS